MDQMALRGRSCQSFVGLAQGLTAIMASSGGLGLSITNPHLRWAWELNGDQLRHLLLQLKKV